MRLYEINTLFHSKFYSYWKNLLIKTGAIFGLYFYVFDLTVEIYSVNLRIQFEYRKVKTWKNSVFGHFSQSGRLCRISLPYLGNIKKVKATCTEVVHSSKLKTSPVENTLYLNHYTFPFDSHINPFMPGVHII